MGVGGVFSRCVFFVLFCLFIYLFIFLGWGGKEVCMYFRCFSLDYFLSFLSSADSFFLSPLFLKKQSFRNTIDVKVSNSWDPDRKWEKGVPGPFPLP